MKPNFSRTTVKDSETFAVLPRSDSSTLGVSVVSTHTMMLRRCMTLLCFRLCISAVGTRSGWLVRNTAVPDTRSGDFFSNTGRYSASGSSSFFQRVDNNRAPRLQVSMPIKSAPPTTRGNHPPSAIFRRLAPRKMRSTHRNGAITRPTRHHDHSQ